MITQRMGVARKAAASSDIWQFTVNIYGVGRAGIPFNLYQQDGITLDVDWGDGTSSTLTSADYTVDNSTASVHTYTTVATYTVKIRSSNWEETYVLTSSGSPSASNNASMPLYYMRNSLISLDSAMPCVAGEHSYSATFTSLTKKQLLFEYLFLQCTKLANISSDLFIYNPDITTFYSCFSNCSALPSIPSGLFDNNTAATSFATCFNGCSNLASIPEGLFANNTAATTFTRCFRSCTSLNNFSLHIGSSSVSSVSYFVTKKSDTTRTIYVPSGSTTQTTFNDAASSLGLTIIGE